MSVLSLQFLYAFNLQRICETVNKTLQEERKKKQEAQDKLSIVYVMSDHGFALVQLFGYHLGNQLKEPLYQIGKRKKVIRVNIHDFTDIMTQQWINMGEYYVFLPLLFSLLKRYNTVSLKDVDAYIQICRKTINPFMAKLKQKIPPAKLTEMIQNIEATCEREDLKGTGFVQKFIIIDIIKKYLGQTKEVFEVDEILLANDQINYVKLLSEEYLKSGLKIREFFYGKLIQKIKKAIRTVGTTKKKKKRKEAVKKDTKVIKKKETKDQKMVKEFIQQNKKQIKEDPKKLQLMVKSLIYECMLSAMEIKDSQKVCNQDAVMKKSVYTTDPLISEHQIVIKSGEVVKLFPSLHETAIFISEGEGKIINLLDGTIKDRTNLVPSCLLGRSSICDYIYFNHTLYILREDGLLCSWNHQQSSYRNMVQTQFQFKHKKIEEFNNRNALSANHGIVVVNCCQSNGKLQFYTLELELIGKVSLKRSEFGITAAILKQSALLIDLLNIFKKDYFIHNRGEYESFLRMNYQYQQFELGGYIWNKVDEASVGKVTDYAEWVISYRQNNALFLDKGMVGRLRKRQTSREDYAYLLKYHYIKESTSQEIDLFLRSYVIKTVVKQERKKHLITLFEDTGIKEIEKEKLTKGQFLQWIQKCSLFQEQLNGLIKNLHFNSQGKICVGQLVKSQQYMRVCSFRSQRFSPIQNYKQNELPPLIFNEILPLPALDYLVLTPVFPKTNMLAVVSSRGTIFNRIDLMQYVEEKASVKRSAPVMGFCQESGYLAVSYCNVITLWNVTHISSGNASPIKILKNLEADEIIGMQFMYYSNSFATATRDNIRFWDLQQLLFNDSSSDIVFLIKPGFKAIQKRASSSKYQSKKRVIVRGKCERLFSAVTKSSNYVVGIVSHGERATEVYIKLFYFCKFHVSIKTSKRYELVPTKIVRQLQEQARKMKYGQKMRQIERYNHDEMELTTNLSRDYRAKLSEQNGENIKQLTIKLINQISNFQILLQQYQKVIHPSLLNGRLKGVEDPKILRYNLLIKLYMTRNVEELPHILCQDFIKLYQSERGDIRVTDIIEDLFEVQDRILLNRLLCLCSLIQKYSRSYNCSFTQLICENQSENIDVELVKMLISNSQMCEVYIQQTITLVNSVRIASPINLVSVLIQKYIPTHYRFPSLRYYKNILIHTQQDPFDYFVNRFQKFDTEEVKREIVSPKGYRTILEHLSKENLIDAVKELLAKNKNILKDNLQLIDTCMCYNLITEQQATFYYLSSGSDTLISLVRNTEVKRQRSIDVDEAIGGILYMINQKKIKLPTPSIAYQWFSDTFLQFLQSSDKVYALFYQQLRGALDKHTIYTNQLQYYLNLSRKKIAINYRPLFWRQLLAGRINSLTDQMPALKKQLENNKIISTLQFKAMIEDFMPKEALSITLRCAYASKNHESFIRLFKEENAAKQYEGMFINSDHFLLYLQDCLQVRQAQIAASSLNISKAANLQIRLPAYKMINHLSRFSGLITYNDAVELMTSNVTDFTYGQLLTWIQSLPFTRIKRKDGKERKMCGVLQLRKILRVDWQMLGWILLTKYGRTNIFSKCLLVDGFIDTKQASQVLLSEAILKLLIQSNDELKGINNNYPMQVLEKIVDREIMTPAIENISVIFKSMVGPYFQNIFQILNQVSVSNDEMEMDRFIKYFLPNPRVKQSVVKLVIANIIGRSKKIRVKDSLIKIGISLKNKIEEANQIQSWIKQVEGSENSLLQQVLRVIEPHQIIVKKQFQSEQFIVTREHLSELIGKEVRWLYSFQPFFTLCDFMDYINNVKHPFEQLQSIVNNCILKQGIYSFLHSIEKGTFPQFFGKCRSISKSFTKLTIIQFLEVYRNLTEKEGKLSKLKIFKIAQRKILPEERINWILQSLALGNNETPSFQSMSISNLVVNERQWERQVAEICKAFKHEQYLIKKYIKSASKLATILIKLQDIEALQFIFGELQLNNDQTNILIRYLRKHGEKAINSLKEAERWTIQSLDETAEKQLLEQIVNFMTFIEQELSIQKADLAFNPNNVIEDQKLTHTSLFIRLQQQITPEWSSLPTYINLYHYSQHLLVNVIFKRHAYRQLVIDQFHRSLCGVSFSVRNLYEVFGLAYSQNLQRYLPFFLSGSPKHHALSPAFFKTTSPYLFESFIKFDGSGKEIKYPLSFALFKQQFGEAEKVQEAALVDYGEVFKQLNIWGCGYVNMNDVPKFIDSNLANPYIEINGYISLKYPRVKAWRKINPPKQLVQKGSAIIEEIVKFQEGGGTKSKLIKFNNLWRIVGSYLTEQHRLYLQHECKSNKSSQLFNIVKVIEWITTTSEQQQIKKPDLLQKVINRIQSAGGVYNLIREYHRKVILAQGVDNYKQQSAFLSVYLEQSNALECQSLRQFVRDIAKQYKIQSFIEEQGQKRQNTKWLQQILIRIVDVYNREVREWYNYNNNLVKFINQLPQSQFNLLKKLYQANHHHSSHKLFDVMTEGMTYFTFNSFWIYNTSSDEAYPYSRLEVQQVYKIIDVNSDGNISYEQFCRFWCAVQQIFIRAQPAIVNAISQTKSQIVQTFLGVIEPIFNKQFSEVARVSLQILEGVTNIKNKQKLQRLIKIVSPEDAVMNSLDVHKLRIFLKRFKLLKAQKRQLQISAQNYLIKYFGNDILKFINSKESLAANLSKWLVFSYPHFGCYLSQFFSEEFGWSKKRMASLIEQQMGSRLKIADVATRKVIQNDNIDVENMKYFRQIHSLASVINQFHKKYLSKAFESKRYGGSVAYKMYFNKTVAENEVLLQEIEQIKYFISEGDLEDSYKLIYTLEQDRGGKYQAEQQVSLMLKLDELAKKGEAKFEGEITSYSIGGNLQCSLVRQAQILRSEYVLLNPQIRGKSNNRFSLAFNKPVYKDSRVSVSFVDESASNNNFLRIYTDFSTFRPLMDLKIVRDGKFAAINSMIKLIEMAYYIQKQHQLIGLFVNASQLCIHRLSGDQFRFTKFFEAIRLDEQGNYLEGVSPLNWQLGASLLIYPPQIYENIFTQTFDSYCLAHILYYLYSGQFVPNSAIVPSLEESRWFNYSALHHLCRERIDLLVGQERNREIQNQIVFYTLIYECTKFEWHLRPKVHQVLQTLLNIKELNDPLESLGKQLIVKPTYSELCQTALQANNLAELSLCFKDSLNNYEWTIADYCSIRQKLPNDAKYYAFYNEMLADKLKRLQDSGQFQEIGEFMSNVVEYLCQSDKKQTAYLALQIYKDIIASQVIRRYLDFCDEQWKINEFRVDQKLRQLNMENRINILPKSSQYYLDMSTLTDSKISLFFSQGVVEQKSKKQDSTKKIAMSFIESSLLSNNVNKISAVLKSEVVLLLYKYLNDPQFEETVLKIYLLVTNSLNADQRQNVHRTVEEGYKIMMVMHNILNLQGGVKKGETVVDMLTFINNYYSFYGEECKNQVLKAICKEQICNLPTLMFLFNSDVQSKDLLYRCLLNMTYQEKTYKLLKSASIRAYETSLKDMRKTEGSKQIRIRIQKLIKYHEYKINLLQLSLESQNFFSKIEYTSKQNISSLFSFCEALIEKHLHFYSKKKSIAPSAGADFKFENNYFQHFSGFLALTRKLAQEELQHCSSSLTACNLISIILRLHNELFDLWSMQQPTIKFLMQLTEKIYEKQYLYTQNLLLVAIERIVFEIFLKLVRREKKKLIKLGFVHFFVRVVKTQHRLIEKYVEKGVEDIQLKDTYAVEAEFRLNVISALLEDKDQEIQRIFVVIGFAKYLIEVMLRSKLILDLRYYKGNFDIVPFRFCNPLRSEAVTILSFILPSKTLSLKSQLVSRLIPILGDEKDKIQVYDESPESKMRFVQTLWLFGTIIECEDERLRYEFVNNGTYGLINKLLDRYPLLNMFFPKMSETIKTGSVLRSSTVFSRLTQH